MKKNRNLLIAILSVVYLLSSCEKVIDLKLDTSAPAIVIQGNVYDHQGPYFVKISKTVEFTDSNIFPPVTDAKVTISDADGKIEILNQITDGTYQTSTLQGIPGNTYYLSVEIEGKTYTASSTMAKAVSIDSIYFEKNRFGGGELIVINFKDPNDTINYYRVSQFVNDTLKSGINIGNDRLSQGMLIDFKMAATSLSGTDALKKGSKVVVQLECIDKNVFEYFRTSRGNNGMSASPMNPTSNISNGALGYFSASSVRKDSITAP